MSLIKNKLNNLRFIKILDIMIFGQVDELITKSLMQGHTPHNVHTMNQSNGIILAINKLGNHFVYINPYIKDNILKYQLCFIALQEQQNNKIVHRIPLAFSGIITQMQLNISKNIEKVKIQMKQYYDDNNIIAVKISTWKKRKNTSSFSEGERNDTLSLLLLDPEQIQTFLKQKNKIDCIHLLQLGISHNKLISDFRWYPFGKFTIITLLNDQNLEVWNIQNPNIALNKLNLKRMTKSTSAYPNSKFTSFDFLKNNKVPLNTMSANKYSLFLMNNCGQIYTIFPFVVQGTQFPKQLYNQLRKNKQDQVLQYYILSDFIKKCKVTQQREIVLIQQCIQIHDKLELNYWNASPTKTRNIGQKKQFSYDHCYSNFYLKPITQDCTLVVATEEIRNADTVNINIGMITQQLKITDQQNGQNNFYWLAQLILEGNQINIINYPENKSHNKTDKYLYVCNGDSIQRIDLTQFYRFAETGDIKLIHKQHSIPKSTLFQLPNNEEIVSFVLGDMQKNVYLVRKTQFDEQNRDKQKIKFEICPVGSLDLLAQINNLSEYSQNLTNKLNKIVTKSQLSQTQDPKINNLKLGSKQVEEYKNKGNEGIKLFQTNCKNHCYELKQGIDEYMNSIKKKYEKMQKQYENFKSQQKKKKQLSQLLQKVEKNKIIIANKLQKPTNARVNKKSSEQLGEYDQKIGMIKNILSSLKDRQLKIKDDLQEFDVGANQLLTRITDAKNNAEKVKQLKAGLDILAEN